MNVLERWIGVMPVTIALLGMCAPSRSATYQAESPDTVTARLDTTIRARSEQIAKYVVNEHYSVYRNGAADTAAEERVEVVYQKSTGNKYINPMLSGSQMLRSRVIEPILDSDRQVNDPTTRRQLMLTSENYEFKVEPAKTSLNGQDCYVLNLRARKKSPYLLNGQAWVNAKTYLLVRIRGNQSKSFSFWAGTPLITRDYENVSGFAMVVHEEIEAHSFMFGQTVIKIDYDGYDILHDGKP